MASTSVPIGSTAHSTVESGRFYRRFKPYQRLMHAILMFTFIGCSLSGLPLLFPYTGWAEGLVRLFGGFEGAALVHRVCAALVALRSGADLLAPQDRVCSSCCPVSSAPFHKKLERLSLASLSCQVQ